MAAEPAYAVKIKQRLGFREWTPHQLFAVSAFQSKMDALIVAPTGSGKTMCYVLPALSGPGLTIVVEPLLALINDQLARMQKLNISAVTINSSQTVSERKEAWHLVGSGHVKLLFIAPERLGLPSFRQKLKALNSVKLFVVDEAHCISQWGHGFRPEYRILGSAFREISAAPILALTATATRAVQNDICAVLQFKSPNLYVAENQRDNISSAIEIFKSGKHQIQACCDSVLGSKAPGIVYCPSRRVADDISVLLSKFGVKHGLYHAGIDRERRIERQQLFMSKGLDVMVATPAFGLGIDRNDIRHIWHLGMPGSLESYIQEIGRAGRDGKQSWSTLFYGPRDYYRQKILLESSFPRLELIVKMMQVIDRQVGLCSIVNLASLGQLNVSEAEFEQGLRFLHRANFINLIDLTADSASEMAGRGLTRNADIHCDDVVHLWYQLEKLSIDKLKAIHLFVKADPLQRADFLSQYFAK